MHLLVAAATEEGGGVNVLPIALVVVVLAAVGLYAWQRKR
jgi:hypothetical protein